MPGPDGDNGEGEVTSLTRSTLDESPYALRSVWSPREEFSVFRTSRPVLSPGPGRPAIRVHARLVAVCALFAALLLGSVPSATAAPVAVGASGGAERVVEVAQTKKVKPAAKYRKQAQKATNRARKRNDLKKFRADKCLAKWARKHAKRLARNGEGIWHQDLQPILEDCNLRSVGENVAAGYPTGKAVVNQGWLKSPGHRANIMNRQFRRSVVLARRSSDGVWYAVQLFGRR